MKKAFLRILLFSVVFFLWAVSVQAGSISYDGQATHETTAWQELGNPHGNGVSWSVDGGTTWGNDELYVGQTVQFKFDVHKNNLGTHYADFLKAWVDWDKSGTFEESSEKVAFGSQVLFGVKGVVNPLWKSQVAYFSGETLLTDDHIGDFYLRARVACSESILKTYLGSWDWDGQWDAGRDYDAMFSAIGHYHQGEVEEWQLTVNPVPEPATMVLFGIGLLGLARIGRKQQ